MTGYLRSYENDNPEMCVQIRSADNFYGARKGVLDPYVQWVYVPAVKDAREEQSEEKGSALGRLLARKVSTKSNFHEEFIKIKADSVRAYDELLQRNLGALSDVSVALLNRLKEWSHPNATLRLVWANDAGKSVRLDTPFAKALAGEDGFEGDVVRLGHGLQRSFILAILHELALTNDDSIPTLLLGVEEPELYQHPQQSRHLVNVLLQISNGNSQIVVTTHNPIFAPGQQFESVRMFRRDGSGRATLSLATLEQVSQEVARIAGGVPVMPRGVRATIHQAMLWSLSDMFFLNRVIFVEGAEDVAFLSYYLQAIGRMDDLRAKGIGFVACAGKSGIIQAAAIAKCLEIPFFIMWDSDGHVTHPQRRTRQENDNLALLKIFSVENPEAFPSDDIFSNDYICWSEEIIQRVIKDLGSDWTKMNEQACNACGHAPDIKKNALYISELIIAVFETGKTLKGLEMACSRILKFSEGNGD